LPSFGSSQPDVANGLPSPGELSHVAVPRSPAGVRRGAP